MTFSASYMYRLRDQMTPEIEKIRRATTGLTKNVTGGAERMSKSLNRVGSNFTNIGKQMTMAGGMITAPLAGMTKQAMDFNKGVAEVSTLMPDKSLKEVRAMFNETLTGIAKDYGQSTDDVVKSAYQAVSAGIDPSKKAVKEFLEIASKAAIGGVTNLETAVDGITSVTNAFKASGISATEVSDQMFTAVRLGKTTFEELSRSMFNVAPVASGLGVKFGDVTSAIAVMTASGVPTRVATRQMRRMMAELGDASTETAQRFKILSGKSFIDFVKEGGNVQEALAKIEEHAKRNNLTMMDMFSSQEAGMAGLALSGEGAEAFSRALEQTKKSAGATGKAFDKMSEDDMFKFNQAMSGLKVTSIELGTTIIPLVTAIAKKVSKLVNKISPWIKENETLVGTILMVTMGAGLFLTTFGAMFLAVGMIIKGIGALITVYGALSVACATVKAFVLALNFAFMANPIFWIVVAVVALIAAIWQLYKHWDTVVAGLTDLWKRWADYIVSIDILGFWIGVGKMISNVFWKVIDSIKSAWDHGVGFLKYIMNMYFTIVFGIADKIKTVFCNVWEGIKSAFVAVWDGIVGFFKAGIDKLVGFLPDFIKTKIGIDTAMPDITPEKVTESVDKFGVEGGQVGGTAEHFMAEPKSQEVDVNVTSDVGGTLKIEIDSKGNAVLRQKKENGNLGYQVG